MFIEIMDGKCVKTDGSRLQNHHGLGIFKTSEYEQIFQQFALSPKLMEEFRASKSSRFESHDGFDLIFLNTLDYSMIRIAEERIFIYYTNKLALIFCDDPFIMEGFEKYLLTGLDIITLDRAVYGFMKHLTEEDDQVLEKLEGKISSLEDRLISSKNGDFVQDIIYIRHKLMVLKNYYEQLFNVLDGIQENENQLISEKMLRFYKIFSGRVDRLYHRTLNLRDYVTQVRESYQAQVDINLNQIMKIFTVITAIFLPLTLIVGWYGMNFQMPEYGWSFGYPLVILLSIVVIGLMVLYFKKNKWF